MQKFAETLAYETTRGFIGVAPGAELVVYQTGGTTLATLYADDEVSTLANPIASDANGLVQFKLANGTYDFVARNAEGQEISIPQVLAFDSADAGLTGSGQQVSASINTVVTCSTVMPIDNTTPQNTEGDQVVTVSITPANASSVLEITYSLSASTTTGLFIGAAVFKDSVANALAGSACIGQTTGANQKCEISRTFRVVAGSTAAQTFKLRVGPGSSGTVYVNGDSSGALLLNGALDATIIVKEVLP